MVVRTRSMRNLNANAPTGGYIVVKQLVRMVTLTYIVVKQLVHMVTLTYIVVKQLVRMVKLTRSTR